MNVQRILLRNFQAPGDILMLTAAVRDLHRSQPGRYAVDVRTSVPALWENNPYLAALPNSGPDIKTIDCEYPSIHESNRLPFHFLTAFPRFLSDWIGSAIELSEFKGDIHLSESERSKPSPLLTENGSKNYWLISAGGKRDFTIKWWDHARFQQVVDHFRGRITFVQVGAPGDFHPKLRDAVDLRGRTSIRELIHLMHYARGALTPVSFLMHLSAAVPPSSSLRALGMDTRPCVVVAGGREPPHWETYPTHQFIHTVGALACCSTGGCWRSRVKPLGDGSEHDSPRRICVDVVGRIPRCMDMISADDVIRKIELYLDGMKNRSLRRLSVLRASERASRERLTPPKDVALSVASAPTAIEETIRNIPTCPQDRFGGRGLIIAAGGAVYLSCAWVCIHMLRKAGCRLPIQIWHLGEEEVPEYLKPLFNPLNVEFVDAQRVRRKWPARRLGGWPLKAYAIMHSKFKEAALLDADNVSLIDPAQLFDWPEYKTTGAIFWPDVGRVEENDPIWKICGVEYRDEPAFESGQLVIDKERCWRALSLALWMNERSDFFYDHMHGDKETFHMAFRRLNQPYAIPPKGPQMLKAALLQHDFQDRVIFQHRGGAKWSATHANPSVRGFLHEDICLEYLERLAEAPQWKRFAGEKKVPSLQGQTVSLQTKLQKSQIVFRAPINSFTGYGLHACQIAQDILALGIDIQILPIALSEKFAALPQSVKERLAAPQDELGPFELLLHPPRIAPLPGKQTVYSTMWETTELPETAVDMLNQAICVVVPCKWNLETFRKAGVTSRLEVIPLGVNADVFRYRPMRMDGPCVFGAAAKLKDSDPARKRIDRVVEAFLSAFPIESDVRLRIKIFPDCEFTVPSDERIEITSQFLLDSEMADWFASLTCFISASAAEGWGLMPHQALAVGRPVITAFFGGVTEFANQQNSYIIAHREVPATGSFEGMGNWSEASIEEMILVMKRVYGNRAEAGEKGRQGASDVGAMTWRNANEVLLALLHELKFY